MSIKDQLYGSRTSSQEMRRPTASQLASAPSGYAQGALAGRVSDEMLRALERRLAGDPREPSAALEQRVRDLVTADPDLQDLTDVREALVELLAHDVLALGPIGPLLADANVAAVMVNGPSSIFYEREGLQPFARAFLDRHQVRAVAARLLAYAGRTLDASTPVLTGRLPDGSVLEVVQPPVAYDGVSFAVRRAPALTFDLAALVSRGTLSQPMAVFLDACVRARVNVVVSGVQGSGRSSLLAALAKLIPADERVVLVEEQPQLAVSTPNTVRLQPCLEDGQGPTLTLAELVRTALRLRPTRVLLGECRGAEALELLLAMGAGLEGTMFTLYAASPQDAAPRLAAYAALAGSGIAGAALERLTGFAVQLLVHLERGADGVQRVAAIHDLQWQGGALACGALFTYRAGARGQPGAFVATGQAPHFLARLQAAGIHDRPAKGG